jgi:hypothetical protein
METYLKALSQFLVAQGWETSIPRLLDQWSELIEACKDGYQWDISEYHHELMVRERLERILTASEIAGFQELAIVRQKVEELDQIFRGLLQTGVVLEDQSYPWWERGVLKYAGEPYADYVGHVYGIEVSRVAT